VPYKQSVNNMAGIRSNPAAELAAGITFNQGDLRRRQPGRAQ